jgi:hypothetical protein
MSVSRSLERSVTACIDHGCPTHGTRDRVHLTRLFRIRIVAPAQTSIPDQLRSTFDMQADGSQARLPSSLMGVITRALRTTATMPIR